MPSLAEVRNKYPQYNDMSDQEFADKFHAKFYSDLPKEEFYQKLSFFPSSSKKEPESFVQKASKYAKTFNESVEGIPQTLLEIGAGAGQGLANTGAGINRLLTKGANLIPGVNLPEGPTVDIAPNKLSSKIGEFGGSIAGGGSLLKYLNAIRGIPTNIGTEIAKNAFAGSAMSPEEQGLGALLGGGGSALGAALGKILPKVANKLGLGAKPGRETIEGLDYEKLKPSIEAAERLGTPLRPSEASRNPFIGGLEGKYPRTREAAYENVELGMQRSGKEKKAINKLLSTIYDKSTASDNKLSEMYSNVSRWNLKPELTNHLKQDPLIAKAIDIVKKDPAWQRNLKNTSENNVAFLDKVKRELGEHEEAFKRASGGKGKAREYGQARKNLTKALDQAVPGYKSARNLAERKIARESIEKKLKKSEVSGSEFFKKIIENDQEFNKKFKSLRNVPEAQSQLKDMKEAWHSLINVEKPGTAAYQSEKSINQARGSLQRIENIWRQLTGKKKNVEAIKFIRSNKWVEELKEASKSKDKNRLENTLSGIIGKILPGGFNAIKEKEEE